MTSKTEDEGERVQTTLEDHERAVKRLVSSLGDLQTELERAAEDVDDGRARDRLIDLGRRLETHEDRLTDIVATLDEHKRVLRQVETSDRSALADAMERARRRARQETRPPSPDHEET